MTVNEAKHRITVPEFQRWVEFYAIEPWGEERADLRAGIVAAVIANCHRGKNTTPYSARDFMPDFRSIEERARPTQTSAEHWSILSAFAKAHNARVASGIG